MNPEELRRVETRTRTARATGSFGALDEDLDSLGVLRQGSAFAFLISLAYLLWEIYARGSSSRGMILVWVALLEVGVYYAGLWSKRILAIWKPWTLCFGIILITTFSIFGHLARNAEVTFVSALLCPLATAAYVAWGPSWQLAMNAVSLTIFLVMPNLLNDPLLNPVSHLMGLLTALAFAQSGALFLDRYRRRLRRQVHDLEEAAQFREAQIGAMAHDVRSPVAALTGYATLLMAEDLTAGERADLIARLGVTAWNMDLVVGNLLDMYQIQERNLIAARAEIDLNAQLHEVAESCAMHARRRGVELVRELHPIPLCRQDPRHIERIVKNVAGFAINRADSGAIRMKCGTRENQIRIEIHDEGPPLSDRELFAFMAPIEAHGVPDSSRGLNLYIARMLTEASGGSFQAQRGERGLVLVAELPIEGQYAPRAAN